MNSADILHVCVAGTLSVLIVCITICVVYAIRKYWEGVAK